MTTSPQRSITNLPVFSCIYLEFPENSREDCSLANPDICVKCPRLGRFMSDGKLDDFGTTGHIITMVQWVFVMVIGIFGTFTNSLIIIIMKRQKSQRTFNLLLMALACFDLLGSVTSVIASTSTIAYFENWGRGPTAQYFAFIGVFTCFFARSGSSFMTVLIAAERYLVIAFPIRSTTWFTSRKTKGLIGLVFGIAALIALPRFTSFAVRPNNFPRDIPSVGQLDYVIQGTSVEHFWYVTTNAFLSAIDFWVPVPLLLLFNVLVFIEIRKFANKRREMSVKQRKEIRAIKMFVPVVIALFLCNVDPCVYFYYLNVEYVVYRELFLGVLLSVAVNSAVNLPIYYFKGGSFRAEVRALFASYNIRCPGGGLVEDNTTEMEKSTGGSGLPVSLSVELSGGGEGRGKWEFLTDKY